MSNSLQSILKTPTSVRKTSQGFTPKLQVRFEVQGGGKDPFDIVDILKNYVEGKGEERYLKLLQLKNDPNMNDTLLMTLLHQLDKSTFLLGPKVERFIDAVLSVSWSKRSPEIMKTYQNFLLSLVMSNPFYCKPVVRMIAKLFQVDQGSESAAERGHEVLRGMTRLVPLSRNLILEVLSDCFPYIGTATAEQANYARNLLHLPEYLENTRSFALTIICNRLLKLDVNTPRDLIRRSEGTSTSSTGSGELRMTLEAAATLDELMLVLFTYVKSETSKGWDETRALYRDLTNIFETLFLPATDLHHAPFVMFLICSIKASVYEAFVDKLWSIFENPASAYVIRKSAMDYMGSLLARAEFIPVTVVLICLEKFCKWIHKYISRQNDSGNAPFFKIHSHLPFYFVCGAVFGIVAARWSDFAGNKKHLTSLEALNLPRVVSCSLNPLRYCHPEVVRQFSQAGSYLQLVLCETILAENRRHYVPEAAEDFIISGDPQFPFDCYLLKKSSPFVEPLLRQTVPNKPQPSTEVQTTNTQDEEDKDFFMEDLDLERENLSTAPSLFYDDFIYN